jgi:hypothetical protein
LRRLCAIAIGAVLLTACAGGGTGEQDLNAGVSDIGSANGGANGGQSNAPSGGATADPAEVPPPTVDVFVRFEDQIRTDLQTAGVPADRIDCVNDAVAGQLRAAAQSGALSDGPDLTIRSYYRSPAMAQVFVGCEVDPAVANQLPSN